MVGYRCLFKLLLITTLLTGCAAGSAPPLSPPVPIPAPPPQAAPEPEPEKPLPVSTPLPAGPEVEAIFRYAGEEERHVGQRLSHYQEQTASWQLLGERLQALLLPAHQPAAWQTCLAELEGVTAKYQRAREQLRDLEFGDAGLMVSAAAALAEAQRADLAFGAGDCRETHRLVDQSVAARLADFQAEAAKQQEALVIRQAEQGRAAEALRSLADLRRSYPERVADPQLIRRLSLALVRAGARDQALLLLAEQEADWSSQDAARSLARLRADLLLVAGRQLEARTQYEKIASRHAALAAERQWVEEQLRLLRGEIPATAEERELFAAVLRDYVLFDGRLLPPGLSTSLRWLESRYPVGILTFRAKIMAEEVATRARQWLGRQIGEIEALTAQRQYDQAIARLEQLKGAGLDPEQQVTVRNLLNEALAARREEEQRRLQLAQQGLARQWEEANRLLGLRKYDAAMQAFAGLRDSEYGEEARRRMEEAAAEAAGELRREAAGLFVRARRDGDREAALESWRLLRRIIEHYPASGFIARVEDNLRSVEEYLESLEPGLVEGLRRDGSAGPVGPEPAE